MSYYDPRDDRTRQFGPADGYQQGYEDAYAEQPQARPAAPREAPPLDIPKFVMGSVLVAVVAGLAAWLLTAALNAIYRLSDAPAFAAAQRPLTMTIASATFLTLIGAALLATLIVSAPRPGLFFGLIATLAGLAITLGPLLSGATSWQMWISTGLINAMLAVLIPILLLMVGRATVDPRRVQL
ncbi:hypothetical protein AXK57_15005 [Tsukamurella pulmonis]|uniref:hypothetical protein n=1 Tax=Tsukamurella pulmonis TaxID=47312 RepID=UPI000792A797|nr:hypothetical protein [Tsukamurella pulmonis]KXP09104.1 hypothetical protein AXK57_15005 [Tsukamurella pulmonis]RDH11452.1 hypothetical protein DVB88_12520 [Tsukamurella pulmonis]